ncbi:YveK family protein [Cohnella lupini]|uniref:Capsular polysaccharide biosynthesis protein n=1 Tax=Cohnella lupini TaxID=1294267 RepID=A0A3D9ITL8_9BACL|nr:Wzz/FepE/Etk N-terminal domain-containing protein [Cohnella lupini]RED65078.1 capsular polysaccharide biosynthesis protein [Cohnella lupini]
MELKHYWSIIRQRLWVLMLIVIFGTALSGIYSEFFVDKQYVASTKIIVNQKEYPEAVVQDPRAIDYNINLIKTYKEIIKTPRIMNTVTKQYPDLNLSVADLIDRVSVSTVNGTQVMSVIAEDTSYHRAAQVANAVTQVFQREIPLLMNVDNVNILNEADESARPNPTAPNTSINLVLSVVVSFFIGIGLIFLLHYLDDTAKSEGDIRQILDLPTLAYIPRIKGANAPRNQNHVDQENSVRGSTNATINA